MINKIQELIEDNSSISITRNQVIMGLAVIGTLLLLIAIFIFGIGGPDITPDYVSTPPINEPLYSGN